MKEAIITFITFLAFNTTLFGQTSDFDNIFRHSSLKQLRSDSLVETDFVEIANQKTIILTSLVKGCKWRLEEMAYYNKLKHDYPNEFEVFLSFSDDIGIMSKYIREVGFDFIYIYDPTMSLHQNFSQNDTIYSVLFDSAGQIQKKMNADYLDHKIILNQLNRNQTKPSNTLPILNFQLKRYELGDEVSSNLSSVNLPTKIMTGYKANESIDTIENIKFCTLTGENILGLYSYAYNLPKNRFVYDKDLSYIDSHAPDKRYTLILSVSSLQADFNKMLIKQIDLNFGLETSASIEKKELLMLSKIDSDNGMINIANSTNKNMTVDKTISETEFLIKADNIKAAEISRLIEEKVNVPVELNINSNLSYSVNISIENNDKTIDNWIKLFSENGLILDKKIIDTQYVTIKNGSR